MVDIYSARWYKRRDPPGVLRNLQAEFHAVIRSRAERVIEEHGLRLRDLETNWRLAGRRYGSWF